MLNAKKRLNDINDILNRAVTLNQMSHQSGRNVAYDTHGGSCRGVALMNESRVAVQAAELTQGTSLNSHIHPDEEEVIALYEGDMTIQTPKGSQTVKDKGVVIVPPNTPHVVSSENGCKIIGITIPASTGYPQLQQQ